MKSNIVILGSGVAALTNAYHLTENGYSVTIVSPDKDLNIKLGGARFLHEYSSPAFDKLVNDVGIKKVASDLTGGVAVCEKGKMTVHSWEYLVRHKGHCDEITRKYAEYTGRVWSKNILNRILLSSTPPRGILEPTYAQLVEFMLNKVKESPLFTYLSMQISSISRGDQVIRSLEKEEIGYSLLINTIPFWVFKDLFEVYIPVKRQFIFSESRYATMHRIEEDTDEFSMTYYAGPDIMKILGLPMKRISVISGYIIREFYTKPTGHGIEGLVTLPPNIVDTPLEDWDDVIQQLRNDNIWLLGRFSEMKSKMMFTDIIDQSAKLVENL